MNNKLRIILVFSIWTLLFIFIQYWILVDLNQIPFLAFIDALISNLIIVFFSASLFFISKNYQPNSYQIFHPIAILLAGVYGSFLLQKHAISFMVNDLSYHQFVNDTSKIRLVYNFLMIISATMISFIWNYKTNKQAEIQRNTDNEQLLREAELLDLRQQIQPHFLFNSLNSISALLVIKPNLAQKMIQELAEFLRGTLKKENNGLVTLTAEMNHLQLYLNIEMVRFEHRLKVENSLNSNTENMLLPTLLLQPIVENAIKFGLYGTTEQITIQISSKIQNEMLFIEITNPYDTEAHHANKGAGFGLNSIARRLYLLFGRNDLLKIHTEENIFITQILIPQKTV